MMMRRLAWDGIVLEVPSNWELACYHKPGGGQVRLFIEDEISRRLEIEWMVPHSPSRAQRFLSRATKSIETMMASADRRIPVDGLPEDWRATLFEFRETLPVRRQDRQLGVVRHELVTAVYAPSGHWFRCVLRFHFLPGDPEDPLALVRQVIRTFDWADRSRIRWQVFDLDFELDAAFVLEATAFDIGAKLMIFRRERRRLYVWTLSCADRIFSRDVDPTAWVSGFLNGRRPVPGIMFQPGPEGNMGWRRAGLLALCHRDELARWCFRYTAGYYHDRARNQVRAWVFSYRHPTDLEWIRDYPAGGVTG